MCLHCFVLSHLLTWLQVRLGSKGSDAAASARPARRRRTCGDHATWPPQSPLLVCPRCPSASGVVPRLGTPVPDQPGSNELGGTCQQPSRLTLHQHKRRWTASSRTPRSSCASRTCEWARLPPGRRARTRAYQLRVGVQVGVLDRCVGCSNGNGGWQREKESKAAHRGRGHSGQHARRSALESVLQPAPG